MQIFFKLAIVSGAIQLKIPFENNLGLQLYILKCCDCNPFLYDIYHLSNKNFCPLLNNKSRANMFANIFICQEIVINIKSKNR